MLRSKSNKSKHLMNLLFNLKTRLSSSSWWPVRILFKTSTLMKMSYMYKYASFMRQFSISILNIAEISFSTWVAALLKRKVQYHFRKCPSSSPDAYSDVPKNKHSQSLEIHIKARPPLFSFSLPSFSSSITRKWDLALFALWSFHLY